MRHLGARHPQVYKTVTTEDFASAMLVRLPTAFARICHATIDVPDLLELLRRLQTFIDRNVEIVTARIIDPSTQQKSWMLVQRFDGSSDLM